MQYDSVFFQILYLAGNQYTNTKPVVSVLLMGDGLFSSSGVVMLVGAR